MLHEPAKPVKEDQAVPYKTRLGVQMFILYALIYAGFVFINITKPTLMEMNIIFGLNLAVIYGFGLIILSLIMALIYNSLCIKAEKALNEENIQGEDK
jgi:uncharacterized membrane protein (DUF485 family)